MDRTSSYLLGPGVTWSWHGSRLVLDVGYGLVGEVESNRMSRALGPDLYPFEREAEDEASVRC